MLLDEHADVIREAVKAIAAEMMELEVSELTGAGPGRAPAGDRRRIAARRKRTSRGEGSSGPRWYRRRSGRR